MFETQRGRGRNPNWGGYQGRIRDRGQGRNATNNTILEVTQYSHSTYVDQKEQNNHQEIINENKVQLLFFNSTL